MGAPATPARSGLFWRIYLSILAVGLGAVLTVGLVTRVVFSNAFLAYMHMPGGRGMGMGPGRTAVMGVAEEAFIASVDRGMLLGGLVAVAVAAVAAYVLARALSSPLRQLENGARLLAAGDLAHRVTVSGPAEVAALGESFNAMADALQQAEALRRRLVADVAHELRNPLAAARAQAEGMADGVFSAEESRLRSLLDDIEHLSHLIDELQELALAEAGRLGYVMEPLDLAALAGREVERARAQAMPGVEVLLEGEGGGAGEGGTTVPADESRISQVMRNLLSNALRHTEAGSVTVRVEPNSDYVEVTVADTGTGIEPADLPHVFERFYRADSTRTRATGGAGLGLAISKRIIEDHGGSVFASSEPGGGTTVGFRLPRSSQATDPERR